MNDRYPFSCSECETELILTLEQAKQKVICEYCVAYIEKFAYYIEDFKKELPFTDNENAIARIIEYITTMNTYAKTLGINIEKNLSSFEQMIQYASKDPKREFLYLKLKFDIYERLKFLTDSYKEQRVRNYNRKRSRMYDDYGYSRGYRSSPRSTQKMVAPSEDEIKFKDALSLVHGDPEEYLNYTDPTPIKSTAV